MAESPSFIAEAEAVISLGIAACRAYERPDLLARLESAAQQLTDHHATVVVAGEFKQGKSSLVNALLGTGICPVDDDMATAIPTVIRYGETMTSQMLVDGDPPERESLAPERLSEVIVEAAGRAGATSTSQPRVLGVEIHLPRAILADGLALVDTPGIGGLGSPSAATSLAQIAMADAVLFVSDAGQELTRTEMDFLTQARKLCETVVVVQTKKDLYPSWRRIRDLNESHLAGLGLHDASLGVVPVSSTLRSVAVRTKDTELNQESGFPVLVDLLRQKITQASTRRAAGRAAGEVIAACQQLESTFDAERAALIDPETTHAELDQVKKQVESLKHAAARWNQTLNDGVADLNSDIDHDLRARIRNVIQTADELIEQSDPADVWSELEAWLRAQTSHHVVANYTELLSRATELSDQVADHFRQASGTVLDQFAVYHPERLSEQPLRQQDVTFDRMGVGKQTMVALRSSYGGILMFTMLSSMAGVALGPVGIGIGLVMGHRGLREEKKRQLTARRNQARGSVRHYCDEVAFATNKDSRDTLRRIQRQIRDHYSARAEELNASTSQALRAASEIARQSQSERDTRLKNLNAELDRLKRLRTRAEAVTP